MPTCYASSTEYVDADLTDRADPRECGAALSEVLPEGIEVLAAAEISTDAPSLQVTVAAAEYVVVLADAPEPARLSDAVEALLEAPSLVRTITKKGKEVEVDLRPGIFALQAGVDGAPRIPRALASAAADSLWCRLATQPRNVRPTEILPVLGVSERVVHRTSLLLEPVADGIEPLPLSGSEPARVTT